MSITAGEYGYKKVEIADYLKKDPAAVTLYMRDKNERREDIEKVVGQLGRKRVNVAVENNSCFKSDNMKKAAPAVGQ